MSPVALAWRTIRADRRTQVSTTLTALGVAVATGLVLLLVSLPLATQSRAERVRWQQPTGTGAAVARVATSYDQFDGRLVTRIDVAPLVDPARITLPPGVDRLPGPGEALLSPDLARLAATRPAAELADRFVATPVGRLGAEALRFPEQLVLLVGHTRETVPATAAAVSGFGDGPVESDQLLSLLAGVGVVVLLVPSLVLVASAARLTAARRERRLAALRLAGATPAQVVAMVAAETGVAAVAGTLAGVAVSPVARSMATTVPWDGGTWYPRDFALPWHVVAGVAAALVVLVAGAAIAGLRRVLTAPLTATGGHPRRRPSAVRVALVPVAALLFFWALTVPGSSLPLYLSLGLLMWSPTVVGPWVTSALGGFFTKVWRRPATLLAGRRLRDDPRAAYRASAGVVLAVFAGALALTVLPSLEAGAGAAGPATGPYRDSVLHVTAAAERAPAVAAATDRALAEYGVAPRAVAVGRVAVVAGEARLPGLVATCAETRGLLRMGLSCRSEPSVYAPSAGRVSIGAGPLVAPVVSGVPGVVLVEPALLPGAVSTVDIAVSADGVPRELVRTALLVASGGAGVVSGGMPVSDQNSRLEDLRRVTIIGLVTAALLAGASAAIATAGSVLDRRRTFGALMAAGTPVRTLARALRTEAALPALAATVGAGVSGTVAGVGLFGLVSGRVPVVSPWLAAPVLLGILVALLAASVCAPALRRVSAEPLAAE